VIGLVLAAGAGRRLGALTEDLPKALLPVRGETSLLELTLHNLASVGLTEVAVVTGFAAHRVAEAAPGLEERCGVTLELVPNDKALEWNNAYSLWCARALFDQDVMLCNGDTLHPASVEERLLAATDGPDLQIGLETRKHLADEEMKVYADERGHVLRINKALDPQRAQGEYLGVSLIRRGVAAELADALKATFERDPGLYYEDGYQELVDRGVPVGTVDIGEVSWVEVDDERDLERAREIACRS
jgi:choline kinase